MNMITELECATKLLDESLPIDLRARIVGEFFKQRVASVPLFGRRHRLVFREVVADLINSVPADQRPALERILCETGAHNAAKRNQKARQMASEIRSLAPGTAIIVRDRFGERSVVFREMKRTRFIFGEPDGGEFSAPVQSFVRVDTGRPVEQREESSDEQPSRCQPPSGSGQDEAKTRNPRRNAWEIRGFLDYIAATPRNRHNDPAQFSIDAALDFDLKELILHMVRAVAEAGDIDWFRDQVLQYPDAAVRDFVLNVLGDERTVA